MDKVIEIIIDKWNEILKKEYGTILCIFTSKNEKDIYASKINTLIASDKCIKCNLMNYQENEYRCYYRTCNLTSCIGIGGVDYIIYVDCCLLENFETVLTSNIPILSMRGRTIIIDNKIVEKYKNISFLEIYEKER